MVQLTKELRVQVAGRPHYPTPLGSRAHFGPRDSHYTKGERSWEVVSNGEITPVGLELVSQRPALTSRL